jgi:predicted Zn-ribbon and HTH transcriptional regulator
MKAIRWQVVRRCPYCKSSNVRRSHRRGFFEAFFFPILLLRPFRCEDCSRRHYNSFFARLDPRARLNAEKNA